MYIKCKNNESSFLTWFEGDIFLIKEPTKATQFQPCEIDEQKNIKTDLFYIIGFDKIKKSLFIKFDFQNSTFEVNGKKYNVTQNHEFTFKKIRGKNILANGGILGFYDFILTSMNREKSAFYTYTFGVLEKLS